MFEASKVIRFRNMTKYSNFDLTAFEDLDITKQTVLEDILKHAPKTHQLHSLTPTDQQRVYAALVIQKFADVKHRLEIYCFDGADTIAEVCYFDDKNNYSSPYILPQSLHFIHQKTKRLNKEYRSDNHPIPAYSARTTYRDTGTLSQKYFRYNEWEITEKFREGGNISESVTLRNKKKQSYHGYWSEILFSREGLKIKASYHKEDLLHHIEKPALTYYDPSSGQVIKESYYKMGELHRPITVGPAHLEYYLKLQFDSKTQKLSPDKNFKLEDAVYTEEYYEDGVLIEDKEAELERRREKPIDGGWGRRIL